MARRAAWVLVPIVVLAALSAAADAPKVSIRPQPRPEVSAMEILGAPTGVIRPQPRPKDLRALPPTSAMLATATVRPQPRPNGLADTIAPRADELATLAPPPVKPGKGKKSRSGSVCGDPRIKGEKLARITSKTKGCGVDEPVRITSVSGVRLSQPATLDCDTAIALGRWVDEGMRPAFGRREVVELEIAAHYVCRPRNNAKGNRISEHGRGKAIDIAGFIFADGSEWSVLKDYNKQIRKAHKAACGIFGTTLGPGSDGFHENHLHLDTASYRGGPYCR